MEQHDRSIMQPKVVLSEDERLNFRHSGGYIVSYTIAHDDGGFFGTLAISMLNETAGDMLNYIMSEVMKAANCERECIGITGIFKL